MKYLFIHYPKCSTCKKAKQWLEEHQIDYVGRHIVEENPTADELKKWIHISGQPLKKLFNTSGILYREMSLKDKLGDITEEEQIRLLASNGMLVKRPLLIGENKIMIGFEPQKWSEMILDERTI